MEIYKFRKDVGHNITNYNSNFIMSHITQTQNPAHIACMYLEMGGIIGYHQAVVSQLLLIVSGEGFVRGEGNELVKVHSGEAVLWKKDEWHETKTHKGLTAIVIESEELDTSSLIAVSK